MNITAFIFALAIALLGQTALAQYEEPQDAEVSQEQGPCDTDTVIKKCTDAFDESQVKLGANSLHGFEITSEAKDAAVIKCQRECDPHASARRLKGCHPSDKRIANNLLKQNRANCNRPGAQRSNGVNEN